MQFGNVVAELAVTPGANYDTNQLNPELAANHIITPHQVNTQNYKSQIK